MTLSAPLEPYRFLRRMLFDRTGRQIEETTPSCERSCYRRAVPHLRALSCWYRLRTFHNGRI